MSKPQTNSNIPIIPMKHKSGTSQIQHNFDNALEILSKNTQLYLNYLKYLAECSKQLKKVNETLSGITYEKNVHPQLKDTNKIFDSIEKNNQEMRKFIKSDEVKNCEKRESRENDFITKKKQEIKKLLSQITNLHNDVIRIIKKPPDCINCFNALEDGFKYHCSYLFYCTRLTCCQEKLFGYVNEIQEEVLSIRTDLAKLQSECNDYAYKLFLQYNPNYHKENEQNSNSLPQEIVDQISEKFNNISRRLKKNISKFREPQFPSLHLYHFTTPFKPLSELDSEINAISVILNPPSSVLIEQEKLSSNPAEENLNSNSSKKSTDSTNSRKETDSTNLRKETDSTNSNQDENDKNEKNDFTDIISESNQEARLADFLASDSGSDSDEEPFHELNSSFHSIIADTALDTNWPSDAPSPTNSNQASLKSVSSSEGNANYHQKISNSLSVKPRQSMKFVAMRQYKCEDFTKELSVEEKDVVQVLDASMTEYWYCKKGNSEGFLPAIILEPFTEQNKRLKSMVIKDSNSPT